MKRATLGIILTLAVLALMGAGCSAQTSTNTLTADGKLVHWRQNVPGSLERVITVYVPASQASDGQFMHAVNAAVEQANRSPYLRLVIDVPNVLPAACPSLCVSVVKADLAYPRVGYTTKGWDSAGHMYGWGARTQLDLAGMTQQQKINNAVHEVAGHAMGLSHPPSGDGPSRNGLLTDWDLALIANAHRHADKIAA